MSKNYYLLSLISLLTLPLSSCQKDDKIISVCASDIPHAEILNGVIKNLVSLSGYSLEVKVLDWEIQNDAVANKDYDSNYFQHIPYLETYNGNVKLVASCKVHYEPLGIYKGKSNTLDNIKTVAICNDSSNAIRALELLKNKNIIEGNLPIDEKGEKLTTTDTTWSSNNNIEITFIAENLLVESREDYDIVCLPCNTALTGNVSSLERLALEDDMSQVSSKANVIAIRKDDYLNDTSYQKKIDVLTNAMLSKETAEYINNTYQGNITCNEITQVDLRSNIK